MPVLLTNYIFKVKFLHQVTCLKITDKETTRSGILKSEGKAPKQYPRTSKGQQEWELFH
ncbi:MAG: hypothetical protein WCK98_03555 [bacterium]